MTADIFATHKEPDEVFLPLGSERYCQFYDMEMADFNDDLTFYQERIKVPGTVLEIGCGTGRLCRQLAATGADITAIDLSLSMLHLAKLKAGPTNISYVCMDMTELALSRQFDTVIIPYHTLNLLVTADRIKKCLQQIRTVFKQDGKLLLQLFIPDLTTLNLGSKKLFQFQIFDQPDGGKVIKEIRRGYSNEQLTLEERYRVRLRQPGVANEDLSHTLHLAAFTVEKWQAFLHDSGFRIYQQFSDYELASFIPGKNTCLFIEADLY
ncbi:MAG: class I SAM-dependent methyltransferase [Proteobacteria bacterium]|jgi:ubiquinone/menaquinone biosynthesis C-methylase UbiE|nr:class I SAM-dependent methyltransferase [Desulfocapsa sp.]MBU3946195.1 class I SAM-dependent methyltransferase [Pseudomonadota bacterium]MCG2745207.1 class I SAM-dependent methyltransferase [Desulfobacteraceae bacterium]MBU3984544.1 class I SAM-dependent methyltransferase [Pseudomonadota bacterium]MBU4027818.1 class I SAM-dependent methyltransferase [Pseudomonadota bacterium]